MKGLARWFNRKPKETITATCIFCNKHIEEGEYGKDLLPLATNVYGCVPCYYETDRDTFLAGVRKAMAMEEEL